MGGAEAVKHGAIAIKDTVPRVVIVVVGFGGLYAARPLAGAPVSVTLVDQRSYHVFRSCWGSVFITKRREVRIFPGEGKGEQRA